MRILAFESSAKAASTALLTDGVLTAESYQNCSLTHSVTLLPMAEALLAQAGLTLGQVDVLAAAHGPGSFTGVRIGVAAVKGLAWGAELPCLGVSTLEAMAMLHTGQSALVCPVMDARRQQVYNALFRVSDGQVERLTPDRAIALADLSAELSSVDGNIILVGDGAQMCYNAIGQEHPGLKLAPEHCRMQRASGVALAAWKHLQVEPAGTAASLTPFYLRLSQAERERLEKLAQKK